NSPATFDTPNVDRPYSPSAPTVRGQRSNKEHNTENEKSKDITDKHTLDSFLSNHTSEDNASYERVIALEDKKRATKLASQLQSEMTSLALVEAAIELPSIEQQADQTQRPQELFDYNATQSQSVQLFDPPPIGPSRFDPKAKSAHWTSFLVSIRPS
ncbi:hypothetical protein evm_013119, partial [Chilo suppressalis]